MIGLVNSKKFHRTCFLCATFLLRQKKCGKTTLFCHQRSGAQKNKCYLLFCLFWICTFFFFFYCLEFCFTIAVIDCALLVINSAIAASSFTLRKILCGVNLRKNYKGVILLLKLAGVQYGSLNHCLQRKQMQAIGLYAHKAHNCNEVASVGLELLDFRSKIAVVMTSNFVH